MYLAVAAALPQRDSSVEDEKNTIEISTPYGRMKGMKLSAADEEGAEDNFNHFRFLGIPYAEAPVGELRFQDPVPVKSWQGVMNATKFGAKCPQRGFFSGDTSEVSGEEDCLFLNVFTPRLPAARRTLKKSTSSFSDTFVPPQSSLLPVMVYIHGGGFEIGSGEKDPEPLIRKSVVVVTINYRLGPLGFFAGNQGLMDQVRHSQYTNIPVFVLHVLSAPKQFRKNARIPIKTHIL